MAREKSTFRLPRLSLIQKIGAGYAAMALFTTAALLFSSLKLYSINKTTRRVADKDLPAITALIRLRSSVLAQESYAGKYAILKDEAFIDLFHQREKEALADLKLLETKGDVRELDTVKRLYAEYQASARRLFTGVPDNTKRLRGGAERLLASIDASYVTHQDMLQKALRRADREQKAALRWAIIISCSGFLLAIGVAPMVTYYAFGAIRKLRSATHRIAEGDFDYDPQIPHGDEFGDLATDFTRMAGRLKVLEQTNLDASPLTRLPGNLAIERVLDERLKSGELFAFCYADLDNFKPFSDHYGYARGSELLRVTGDLIYETVKARCGEAGFVGHIGGDDFVMVVAAEEAASLCQAVIGRFDEEAARHYDPEDVKAGGIQGYDRYGVQRFFPLTTISIAAIICGGADYSSPVEIARAAAQVKDTAKETPGSSYILSGKSR